MAMGTGTQEGEVGTALRAEAGAGVTGTMWGGGGNRGQKRWSRPAESREGVDAQLLLQDSLLAMEPGPALEAGPGLDSDPVPLLGRPPALSGPPLDSRYPVDPR